MSEQAAASELTATAAASGVLFKLVVFCAMLAILPIGTYFGTLHYVWNGNTTWAAICAIIAANSVLVLYIILSMFDDNREAAKTAADQKTKKTQ